MHSILLVDDDPEILDAWQAILLAEGYLVRCARNGFEALDLLKQSAPDLVITDWMMPLMGGAELCRQLKAHPDLAHLPIMIHSAAPPYAEALQTWNACLQKPVPMKIFLTTVEQLCKSIPPPT
ncbi:PleD family two-component system response regulator [Paraburkholderia sp. BCC1885]|uniref:response regulator n=1 Tax=Paraburkholderia sp. BCC1885 TaxID=2562669 RepID=UPI0011832267|nr:response regulator [Paraburkholderia sp. BCC1885]